MEKIDEGNDGKPFVFPSHLSPRLFGAAGPFSKQQKGNRFLLAILRIRLLGFCRQAKLRPCLWPQRANRFVHLENPFPYCNLQHKISPGFCEAK